MCTAPIEGDRRGACGKGRIHLQEGGAYPVPLQAGPDRPSVWVVSDPGHRVGLPAERDQVGGDVEGRPGHHPVVGELVDQRLAEEQGTAAGRRVIPPAGA